MSTGKICCLVLLTLGVLAVVVALVVILTQPKCGPQRYLHGAVAADTETCSVIGRDILKSGGTAVDAAIAGLICTSVMNPQSSGLGGGVIFTIYNASTGTVEVINARETVPRVFPHDLLSGCSAHFLIGSHWIAVPGELRGYEEAHKRYGRLPWKALFEPTIKLLSEPLVISPVLDKMIHHPNFSPCSLQCSTRGETFRWPALQQTLRAVAENGAAAFYEGQIGKALVDDIKKAGSSISLEDLQAYKAEVSSALNITLNNHTTVFSPGPPMGGAVLMFILKILEGKFLRGKGEQEKIMGRNGVGKPERVPKQQCDHAMHQDDELDHPYIRSRIDTRGDHPLNHYNLFESLYNNSYKSKGTSHISVLAADGSAVSATSTINYPFGSFVYSNQTGIILNNELADFCIANRSIKPGEHSYPQNKTQVTVGIVSLQAIINKLWFGYDLEHAISAPIMHTENDNILFEEHFSEEVKNGLLGRGHKEKKAKFAMNVVQGISKEGKCISAYSDKRKLGKSAGY
uniref:Gamma-glutamyltransferase 5 n=1 Tax=Strix occidentalis caurina TaxID=311401 RepID=A0A8D0F6A8_STROC